MERGNIDFGKLLNGVTTENVYVLTNDNRKVIEALRFLPGNREIKPKKVEDLVKAYQNKEYIPPILVSTPFRFVTEGNHRLAAALECLENAVFKDALVLPPERRLKPACTIYSPLRINIDGYLSINCFSIIYGSFFSYT